MNKVTGAVIAITYPDLDVHAYVVRGLADGTYH